MSIRMARRPPAGSGQATSWFPLMANRSAMRASFRSPFTGWRSIRTSRVGAIRDADRFSAQVKVTERDDDPFRFLDLVKPEATGF